MLFRSLLVRQLDPTVAVFNNGPHKGCAPSVMQTLRSLPSVQGIYQVHRNLDAPEANQPRENCANDGETGGNYLKLSVAPDGRSYTVSVPSTGHTKSFRTRL